MVQLYQSRCRFLPAVFFLALLFPFVPNALYAQMQGLLLNDPETGKLGPVVDFGEPVLLDHPAYERILASEQLCPDRIIWKKQTIAVGHTETALIRKLGRNYQFIDPPAERDPESVKAFCLLLLKEKPNTIHFYNLIGLRNRIEHGWFKTYSWDLGKTGNVLVTFVAPRKDGPYVCQFLRLRLVPSTKAQGAVTWISSNTLERNDVIRATWDIGHNRVIIENE